MPPLHSKHPALTPEDSALFNRLHDAWLAGNRFEVAQELKQLSPQKAVVFTAFLLQYSGTQAVFDLSNLL